ncbi:D-alanyl-D-alanine carboxypeptidase/D-alanyl-D-alanine endopeptidase [Aquipuribacter sp. MA13-13]|uniref:D-alanyl-D-alanine carboxypeptidase/D-alanyl-D-alanine endopeptidase n=1 Tax=Aquipuribacter sp. MA13-13 TaxID=3440840 RepID=UPI003EE9C516
MSIVTASALCVALVAGYAWADAADVVPGPLTAAPPPAPLPSPAPEAVVPAPAAAALDDVAAPAAAAVDVSAPPPPDADALAVQLGALLGDPALGPGPTLSVRDLATGEEVALRSSGEAVEPASTAKLVTAAAALQALGAEHRTVTSVGWVPAGERPGAVPALVLVGGGDLLLGAAEGDETATAGRVGLLDLARTAAAALTEGEQPLLTPGATRVDVVVDDSLLGAPQTLPRGAGDAFFASPPASVAVDAGRRDEGQGRDPDPAATAGTLFAGAVEQALAETLGDAAPSTGPVQVSVAPVPVGSVVAEGRSAPLEDVIAYLLATSDNTVADAVAGLVAVARDQPATLASAGGVLVDVVEQDLGVDLGPTALVDGSGLGDGSVATASALTSLLAAAAARPPGDDVSRLASLLPVAGVDGTLSERFTAADASAAGRGVVRAKTGTLTGTTALAGVTTTASGRGVAFALLSDQVPADGTPAGRVATDRVVAAVAACC